jgi:hypothetical protein
VSNEQFGESDYEADRSGGPQYPQQLQYRGSPWNRRNDADPSGRVPSYPPPDQREQLWEGNPWGARFTRSGGQESPTRREDAGFTDPSARGAGGIRLGRSRGARLLTPLVFAGVALVLVLAAGVIGVVTWRNHRQPPAEPASAADTVRGYLAALAAGDADKAVGYLAQRPASTVLMTEEVLAASAKAAPITKISVPTVDPNAGTVPASYRLGDQTVHSTFIAHRVNGRYLIDNGFLTVDLTALPSALPVAVNGVPIKDDAIALLPGSYTLSVRSHYLGLAGDRELTIAGPQAVPTLSVRPEVTAEGTRAARKAVSAAVADCLKSTHRKAGCGLTVPDRASDGSNIVDGTVHRSLSDSAKARLEELAPTVDPGNPRKATAPLGSGAVLTTATCQDKAGSSGKSTGKSTGKKTKKTKKKQTTRSCVISGTGTALATPVISLSASGVQVSWQ